MKLFTMKFSPASCCFLSLRSEYSPQHPAPKESEVMCNIQ